MHRFAVGVMYCTSAGSYFTQNDSWLDVKGNTSMTTGGQNLPSGVDSYVLALSMPLAYRTCHAYWLTKAYQKQVFTEA